MTKRRPVEAIERRKALESYRDRARAIVEALAALDSDLEAMAERDHAAFERAAGRSADSNRLEQAFNATNAAGAALGLAADHARDCLQELVEALQQPEESHG